MIIIKIESSEDDDESDVEWPDVSTTPGQPSHEDSLTQEELEINQPLLVHTSPVLEVQTNTETLQREETANIHRFLSDGCGCDLANGSCAIHTQRST